MSYTVRPISDRTWQRPADERVSTPFSAKWTETLNLLISEIYQLQNQGMPDPVIEVDVPEGGIRVDGQLRADAKAQSPAVAVAFESIHGPLIYRCNVRAIAMTLQALRAVDRYSATRSAEQYQGFRALPSGTGVAPSGMTVDLAMNVIYAEAGYGSTGGPPTESALDQLVRAARGEAHPDRNGGDRSRWNAVEEAAQVLQRAGRLS